LKLTLLGTGTSQGVPVIGCNCEVCTSTDARDKRLRAAALLEFQGQTLLIDAGPDFRQQMLRAGVQHLDAILLTHEHNDHVIGIDDVRPFNYVSGQPLSVYALKRVADDLEKRFEYVFGEPIPGLPRLTLHHIVANQRLVFGALTVDTIAVMHGRLPILGFRFGPLAYLTDVKSLSEEAIEQLRGCRHLVINALQHREHPTHLNVTECLALIEILQPEQAWLTHSSHLLGLHAVVEQQLPDGVNLAYDGLEIHLSDEWAA
jgi:phosphoribosyl 1,2-cyclic phosphate phosphodiesterase